VVHLQADLVVAEVGQEGELPLSDAHRDVPLLWAGQAETVAVVTKSGVSVDV